MARPSTYRDDIPELVLEYVKNFETHGDLLPTVEGLALYLNIPKRTLYEWAARDDKAEFSHTLAVLKDRQAKMLMENGLRGDYNAAITKLMLSHNHGMYEKTAKELSGPDGGAIPIQEVRRTIVDSEHSNG